MATPNRAAILAKAHKVLKKHYAPVNPAADRGVLEQLMYACCLENAPFDKADEAFARLGQLFFDWNEIRVSTVHEIAEAVKGLPHPKPAARNLKRMLQSVFEAQYSFDLESLTKQNIGKSVKRLAKFGVTPFAIAYVTQNALTGHAIPVDDGVLKTMYVLGVINEAEAEKRVVPGLERAISKAKGVEFGSLIHQLGVEFLASPHAPKVRSIILEIEPGAKSRLPKRGAKKREAEAKAKAEAQAKAKAEARAEEEKTKKPANAGKKTGDRKTPAAEKKKATSKPAKKKSSPAKKKSSTRRLTKQKPR